MNLRRVAYVTLIEMLLVIALISLTAGVIGYNVRQALKKYRFESEVSSLVNNLRLAQDLMLILDADMHLKLVMGPKKTYWLESEKKLPKEWDYLKKEKKDELKSIRSITLSPPQLSKEGGGKEELDLYFLSGGSHLVQGVLTLSDEEDPNSTTALKRFIYFPGYPQPIADLKTLPHELNKLHEREQIASITNITQTEIQSRQ